MDLSQLTRDGFRPRYTAVRVNVSRDMTFHRHPDIVLPASPRFSYFNIHTTYDTSLYGTCLTLTSEHVSDVTFVYVKPYIGVR